MHEDDGLDIGVEKNHVAKGFDNNQRWDQYFPHIEGGNGQRELGEIVSGIREDGGFALWRQLKFDEAGHR
jgi:hypothetical protein